MCNGFMSVSFASFLDLFELSVPVGSVRVRASYVASVVCRINGIYSGGIVYDSI